MSAELKRKLFTVSEYHKMITSGILSERDKVELIRGEVVGMAPIGSRHASYVNRLSNLLKMLLGEKAIISVQNPITLSEYSEPQPDVVVLRPQADFYVNAHPTPSDVFWLIEVAETTMDYDKKVKLPLYAESGVPEVWLVNLPKTRLEVYRFPFEDTYQEIRLYQRGQSLNLNQFPEINVSINDLLG